MMFYKKKFPSIFFLLILFSVFINELQAQHYVSNDQAMERLEIKLSDIHKNVHLGLSPAIEKNIADEFIKNLIEKMELNESIANALQSAETKTRQAYSKHLSAVSTLKEELNALLQE